jgi:hypothetical protein
MRWSNMPSHVLGMDEIKSWSFAFGRWGDSKEIVVYINIRSIIKTTKVQNLQNIKKGKCFNSKRWRWCKPWFKTFKRCGWFKPWFISFKKRGWCKPWSQNFNIKKLVKLGKYNSHDPWKKTSLIEYLELFLQSSSLLWNVEK